MLQDLQSRSERSVNFIAKVLETKYRAMLLAIFVFRALREKFPLMQERFTSSFFLWVSAIHVFSLNPSTLPSTFMPSTESPNSEKPVFYFILFYYFIVF